MKRHYTIPIFVPHLGCPCQCTFCNQKTITGIAHTNPMTAQRTVEDYLQTIPTGSACEIAFFGGSFTAIDRLQMIALLQSVQPYLASGRVDALRVSTRPDAIDEERLAILSHYGVQTVELGIQSASDRVLSACKRGHTFADSQKAAELICNRHFTLGGQMMIGLPASTSADEVHTAEQIVQLGAKEARIYPTVVFRETALALDMLSGDYQSLSVDEAVRRSLSPLEIFLEAKVKMLRIGLCETESLHQPDQVIGGANHPAIGELCYSALYCKRIFSALDQIALPRHPNLKITVAHGRLSMAIGQKRCNANAIQEAYHPASLQFTEDPALTEWSISVDLLS